MLLRIGSGVVALNALLWAADAPISDPAATRVYTVAVDSRTGKLVRVRVTQPAGPAASSDQTAPQASSDGARPVSTRAVAGQAASGRDVPARNVAAREVTAPAVIPQEPAKPDPGKLQPTYNAAGGAAFDRLVERLALSNDLNPSFVHAVIKAESNYNPGAISSKGAVGLMQLMPQTARRFGVRDRFNAAENVDGGVRYLRHLLELYGYDVRLSLAAYNAGEGAVDRFRGVPPYWETQRYVRRVSEIYKRTFVPVKQEPAPPPKKLEGPRIYRVVDASGVARYITDPAEEPAPAAKAESETNSESQ